MEAEFRKAIKDVTESVKLAPVWFYLAWQDVLGKYRRSLLGPFWIAGSLVATSLSLAIVFGGIFGQPIAELLPYVMGGFLVWHLVALPLSDGPETFVGAAGTIKTQRFPFGFYVLRMTTRVLIIFAHNFVAFVATVLILRAFHGFHWQAVPALVLVSAHAAVYSGLAGLMAARFRDLRFLAPFIAQLLFFLTPIFWVAETIKDERALIYLYNPLYHLLTIARSPLLGAPAPWQSWVVSLADVLIGAALWIGALVVFRRRIAFWV